MIIEDKRDSASPFGVLDFLHWSHPWNNYFYDTEKIYASVALMRQAGIGFVRMDFLWQDIEPVEGHFDFKKYDEIIDILWRYDIKVLGILGYSTPWSGKEWNEPPDILAFAKYARAVVRRYKDKIKYWEIWNEPDHDFYWKPQDDLRAYSVLLKTAYPHIKEEDKSALILHGGLSAPSKLKLLYQHGAQHYFDIVNIHPFVDPLASNAGDILRAIHSQTCEIMQEHGDMYKGIWFTEIGCPGTNAPETWWLGECPNELQQAQWVATMFRESLKLKGVKKIFWAFFRDTVNHWGNGIDKLGLIRSDFSEKPAFEAYKELVHTYTLQPKKSGS